MNYIIFQGEAYYPNGGAKDLLIATDNKKEAKLIMEKPFDKNTSWRNILHTPSRSIAYAPNSSVVNHSYDDSDVISLEELFLLDNPATGITYINCSFHYDNEIE